MYHVETANLADGTYELVPKHMNKPVVAQVNLIEVNQSLDHCSEEPKANFSQEGKPRCI